MPQGISRRDMFRIGLAGTATAVLAGCQQSRRYVELEPYVVPPEETVAGVPTWYASTCRQCPAACGIVVRIMNGRAVKIEGNPEHPVNRGGLCARGQSGLQVLYHPDRLQGPVTQERQGSRIFESAYWEDAIPLLAEKIQEAGDGVAVWLGSAVSGHVYDLFRRLTDAVGANPPVVFDLYGAMHGYYAMQTAGALAFGVGALPAYTLNDADVIFGFNADFLGTGLSAVGYGRAFGDFRSQPMGKRGYLVQFEPRMSITGAVADRWAPVQPGGEALVAGAIARLIADHGFGPAARVERATALAPEVDVEAAAASCALTVEALTELAETFANAARPAAIPGGALAGQGDGIAAVMAVQALNAIAGVGVEAPSPGAPVEGLAPVKVSAYEDVDAAIQLMASGAIKALLVYGANPMYDLPAASGLAAAIRSVPFVATFAPLIDETAREAHLVLPTRTYLESWGYSVVAPAFGQPVVGSQQPVVSPRYDARAAGDIILDVAKAIPAAAAALPWADEVAYLKEVLAALPAGAHGGGNADVQWARTLQHGGWWPAEGSVPEAPEMAAEPAPVAAAAFQGDETEYPYYLHLYTPVLLGAGEGASQPWLQGAPDPMTTIAWQSWVELNPQTADALGVTDGDVVKVTSPHGEIEAPVFRFPALRPDTVAIPLGQGHTEYGRYAEERGVNAMALVGAETDATGANLAFSTLRVKVERTGEHKALAVVGDIEGSSADVHF